MKDCMRLTFIEGMACGTGGPETLCDECRISFEQDYEDECARRSELTRNDPLLEGDELATLGTRLQCHRLDRENARMTTLKNWGM